MGLQVSKGGRREFKHRLIDRRRLDHGEVAAAVGAVDDAEDLVLAFVPEHGSGWRITGSVMRSGLMRSMVLPPPMSSWMSA
jgi:hypothetical protein